MIDYKYKDLFRKSSVTKKICITDDTGEVSITNKELRHQKFELTETLCSEERLVFGCCEASVLKFTVANVFLSLKGKWLSVSMTLGGNVDEPLSIGLYKVQSDKPTADRKKREYIAYDALYDIINADVSAWYNALLPSKDSTVTLKEFRDSFFNHFGIGQEEISLVNDFMPVTKTIQPEELSGKVVINAICEINGCFGHIGRSGAFKYIYLEPIVEGLYPSETLYPAEELYPKESTTSRLTNGTYFSADYEDYLVEKITKLQIRQEENDIGAIVGTGKNTYVIQDNFLVYGKSAEDLETIAQNILNKIGGVYYRPFSAKAKGNLCLEVGDAISLGTKYMAIHSYILQRTFTGIQALRDEYAAEGTQYQPTEVNDIHKQIIQLKGKANVLTRTVEETRLEMKDVEKSLRSEFSAEAGEIRAEVEDIENDLSAQIKINADDIQAEAKRAEEAEASLKIQADQVAASVSDLESDLLAEIEITADAITAETKRAEEAEASLKIQADEIALSVSDLEKDTATQFNLLSNEISLKLDAGDVINEINISDEAIELRGNRLIVNSTNFSLDKNGNVKITGEIIAESGRIESLTMSGTIWLDDLSDGTTGYLNGSSLYISEVSAASISGTALEISSISHISSGEISVKDDIGVNGYIHATGYIETDGTLWAENAQISSTVTAEDISCDYLNGGVPITSENYWEYAPAIELTTHAQGGYGSYYYSTDSSYASGDNKSIPSIQWVKDYTTSKYATNTDLEDLQARVTALESNL